MEGAALANPENRTHAQNTKTSNLQKCEVLRAEETSSPQPSHRTPHIISWMANLSVSRNKSIG